MGRSHPITAGTCTTADPRTRTGREIWSRAASRATASTHASGTEDVPTRPSCRVISHPDASRSDRATTPPNHARTTQGRTGSMAARIAAGVGVVATARGPGPGHGATADVAVTTSLVHGDILLSRTAVAAGRASISASVTIATA